MFWKVIWMFFSDNDGLRLAVRKVEQERAEKEFKRRSHFVTLCEKHQPSNPGAHYASHNCTVCRLEELATTQNPN